MGTKHAIGYGRYPKGEKIKMQLDVYLEDKIYELAELMISDNVKGKWFDTPSEYTTYVSYYTSTKFFCEDLAKRLNKAGVLRDAEGNRIDSKWVQLAWNHQGLMFPNLRTEGGYDKHDGTYNLQAMKQTERLC